MFDWLIFAFYWAGSIENCGVFFSYDRESQLNACEFFVIFSVVFSVDYDLKTWCRFMFSHETNEQNCSI